MGDSPPNGHCKRFGAPYDSQNGPSFLDIDNFIWHFDKACFSHVSRVLNVEAHKAVRFGSLSLKSMVWTVPSQSGY